eukprot:TRINITY_DN2083_c0_g1_i3.p1 TRINITY_DN2083_c0_g1~~TRINITY_DN2083_c0_g1_i3.p1  ORF type:complete len:400 (-),score=32.93 TRINITY_DN2083_c0_g1_i3:51-1250(-)
MLPQAEISASAGLLHGLCGARQPLLRSIACWTLNRLRPWICHPQNPNRESLLAQTLKVLLRNCLDRNKQVQHAAISSLASIEEAAQIMLIPHLDDIVRVFVEALQLYQLKNTRVLYDALHTLSWSVGPALNQEQYVRAIMQPLMQRFAQLPDDNPTLMPLFECLGGLVQIFGTSIKPFAQAFVQRCVRIINDTAMAIGMWKENPNEFAMPDQELMASSVDLLSNLIEGLQDQSQQLLAEHNFLAVLPLALKYDNARLKQSGFWLMGTAATHCIQRLVPMLPMVFPFVAPNLSTSTTMTVNMNAAWAVGEVCVRGAPVDPLLPHLQAISTGMCMILARKEGVEVKQWQRRGHGALCACTLQALQHLRRTTPLGEKWAVVFSSLPAEAQAKLRLPPFQLSA